jgi:hypothetical protein
VGGAEAVRAQPRGGFLFGGGGAGHGYSYHGGRDWARGEKCAKRSFAEDGGVPKWSLGTRGGDTGECSFSCSGGL